MTTTDLYSGYDRDGKPTSRVLRPPGGASSNIFGTEPAPQQQLRKQEQKEMNSNENQAAHNTPPAPSQPQPQDVQSKPKPRKGGTEAPYAENDMENPHERHGSSQNDQDFRCHSVTAYREAVHRNAEIRGRAHGGQATSVNPITHQEHNGEGPYNQYRESSQYAAPPPQAYLASNKDYGRKEQAREESALPRHSLNAYKDAVIRNAEIRHKYHGGKATASFNPITHEEYYGEGQAPQQYQHAAPPVPQANLLDRENYGRRDKQARASAFNPITGEEYPPEYGQKKKAAAKSAEEEDKKDEETQSKDETSQTVGAKTTPTATSTSGPNSTSGNTGANIHPNPRVKQPPGGASAKLW